MNEKNQAIDALFALAPRIVRCVGCGVAKKETGLTFNQIRAINFLAEGKRYLGDIARDRSVSPASASALVDSLEREGYVERTMDRGDRRRIVVTLTSKGRQTFEKMRLMSCTVLSELVDNLSDEEAGELARLLKKL